ncbi:hypothetical protein [Aeromicrobium sp.]|uniref:hypothetical protein n=1 Tax=Aeromicrobium sp. TaxID=1871063 RepID=UPI001999CF3F|nr:hypothetical protein [Aeromicrobium sp.]MBC7629885.1 hypothetical protein [Aeromicrobium sp.]
MNLPAHKKMLSVAAAASVLLLTAACGGASDSSVGSSSGSSAADATPGSATTAADFKDGDYESEGSYPNPAGTSKVKVALTVKANKVTALKVTPEATNGTSNGYQTQFAGGIGSEVIGKSLAEVKASKVAGSSLTSEGFNKAIDDIKADAAA